jgi:hypothetical protein
MQMDDLLTILIAYLLDCKVRQLSPKTIQSYNEVLSAFVVGFSPGLPGPQELRAYLSELSETRKPGGVHLVYRYVRALLLWW